MCNDCPLVVFLLFAGVLGNDSLFSCCIFQNYFLQRQVTGVGVWSGPDRMVEQNVNSAVKDGRPSLEKPGDMKYKVLIGNNRYPCPILSNLGRRFFG